MPPPASRTRPALTRWNATSISPPDGEIVINHDIMLDNTTTGTGNIEEMTLEEVLQYEVDMGGGGQNRPIATLREFFEEFKDTDLVHFVEIKSSRPEIVPALKALIEECGVSDQVVVISFLSDQLARVHEQIPALSVGYLFNSAEGTDAAEANSRSRRTTRPITPAISFVTLDQVRQMAARGITVWPWTYPNTQDFDKAYMNGINASPPTMPIALPTTPCAWKPSGISSSRAPTRRRSTSPPWLVTQSGSRTQVSCEYVTVSGTMTILQNAEGKYYAGRGEAVVMLKYTFTGEEGLSYTLYSEPVAVSVAAQQQDPAPAGGCSASALPSAAAAGVVLTAAALLLLRPPHRPLNDCARKENLPAWNGKLPCAPFLQ